MAILIHKLKKLNPKKALITVGLAGLAASLLSFPFAGATGPAFNIFPISYTGALNHDLPLLDARNTSNSEGWSISQADHDAGIQASSGQIIEFSIYYHNGAADTPENIAFNAFANAFANPALGTAALSHTISASVGASNAATATSANKGGNINVYIQGSQSLALSLVPGSSILYPNQGLNPVPSPQNLSDTIFGSGVSIGSVNGCWQFAGFVNFKVQVGQALVGSLTLQKQVKNITQGTAFNETEVNANPNDLVEYQISVSALTAAIQDVFVKDALDPRLALQGSVTLDNVPVSSSEFFGGGVEIDALVGVTKIFRFQAKAASISSFPVGTHILPNTAYANRYVSPPASAQDSANVRVVIQPQIVSCSFTWSAPLVADGSQRGLRHAGELFNVQQDVTGLVPNTAFNIVHQHVSGFPVFAYPASANASGSFNQFNSTVIPAAYIAGDYNVFIQVGGVYVATCKGFRIDPPVVQQINLEKSVSAGGAFDDNQVDASPGSRVTFRLIVSPQNSNLTLPNVIVKDTLPNKLTFVPGSFQVDGVAQSEGGFFGAAGLNLGSLAPGSQKTITFQADVAPASQFTSGQCEILVNTGTMSSVNPSLTHSDTASVRVCVQTPTKQPGSPGARP